MTITEALGRVIPGVPADMTLGDIGFILAFSAVFIVWASINHQRQKRARMQCREEGHLWERVYSGLECSRCVSRWPG